MTTFAIVVTTLFGAWCILTVLAQFPSLRSRLIAPLDLFGLVPLWTFFAPNPGVSDFRLMYRHRLVSGSIGVWREVHFPQSEGLRRAFWNPEKKTRKALMDMVMDIARLAMVQDPSDLQLTVPYISILNKVSAEPCAEYVDAVQFMILETFGYEGGRHPPTVRTLSSFHRLF